MSSCRKKNSWCSLKAGGLSLTILIFLCGSLFAGDLNLGGLSFDERQAIEFACGLAKLEGPAAYRRCVEQQLTSLRTAPRHPDLSGLSFDERQANLIGITTFLLLEGQNLNFAIAAEKFWN